MAVESFQLQNGVRVAIDSSANLKSAAVIVAMRGGPAYEAVSGISHALEHGLFRGTKRLATDALMRELAATGALDETRTLADRIELAIECAPDRVEYAISLLAEIGRWPSFADVEREREVVALEILGDDDDASDLALAAVFGDAPHTRSILGSLDNLARVDRASLEGWHGRVICGENIALAVAGPIDARAVLTAAQRSFGTLPAGQALHSMGGPARIRDRAVRVQHASTGLTELALAWEVPPAQWAAAEAVAFMLAGDEVSSLYRRLRTQQALCYEFACDRHACSSLGLAALVAEARTRPGRAADAVGEILDAMAEIASGVSAADVDRFRDRVSLDAVHASPHDRASTIAETIFAPGGVQSFGQVFEADLSVGAAEVTALAQHLRRDATSAIGIVGPMPRAGREILEQAFARDPYAPRGTTFRASLESHGRARDLGWAPVPVALAAPTSRSRSKGATGNGSRRK